jgi:hypothetical protein
LGGTSVKNASTPKPEAGFQTKDLGSYVRFEVLTALFMKSTIFRDITPCSPFKVNRRFGGTYRLHLLATCFHAGFLLILFFDPEDGGDMLLRNVG